MAVAFLSAGAGSGQQPAGSAAAGLRLNKVIELFQQGKPAFGIFNGNFGVRTAMSLSRTDLDYILIDMEHGPCDVQQLQIFLMAMTDKQAILRKGNLQPNVVPFVRIPQNGRENLMFIVKQVLDVGVFGIMLPHTDTAEQARAAVQAARYPQGKGAPDMAPEAAAPEPKADPGEIERRALARSDALEAAVIPDLEQKAADQGNSNGMIALGLLHEDGRGVPRDLEQAVRDSRQAAELGDALGMCYLGDMYRAGAGIGQSDREAYRWAFVAHNARCTGAAGCTFCDATLKAARKRLSKAEREAAERDAKEWAAALQTRLNQTRPPSPR